MIKNNHLLPMYLQLKNLLVQKIKDNEFTVGDKLPSERDLSTQYQVSRMTARKALTELVTEGYANRQRGKGTYVAARKINRDMTKLSGFSTMLKEKGVTDFTARVVSQTCIEANSKLSEKLEIPMGSMIYKIVRVRYGNDQPMALEYSYLPEMLLPGLLKFDFSHVSLFKTIEEKYGHKLMIAKQQLELGYVKDFHADLLEIEPEGAVFILESVTYDEENTAIEYCCSYTRGDSCVFHNELRRVTE